ncbi:MAG: xanthine dehydrogenase accessory protein XdhC [Deltaproteobacteria bacterium]|nr:xanthine dehydrogenase accessory protein XdhC [Deltaproteobacteria bacterium]
MSWDWINGCKKLQSEGLPFVLVTIVRCVGSTPRDLGTRMIVRADGGILGTIGGGNLEQMVIRDALDCIQKGITHVVRYPLACRTKQCCGGSVEVLMEAMNIHPVLYIFGAGHVGSRLAEIMLGTPFEVHLIDERKDWLRSQTLPTEIITHTGTLAENEKKILWDKQRTFIVVMTHDHQLDEQIIESIFAHKTAYIGLIGSESKWATFEERLSERGTPAEKLKNVRCPVGLDIGGKSPSEIAISIAAELIKAYHGK